MDILKDVMKSPPPNRGVAKCSETMGHWYDFFPVYAGTLKSSQVIDYEGSCFKSIKFSVRRITKDELVINLNATEKKSFFCKERLFLSLAGKHHVESIFRAKNHHIKFMNLAPEDITDFNVAGLRMYQFCYTYTRTFFHVLGLLRLYVGGMYPHPDWPIIGSKVPWYMEDATRSFLKDAMNYENERRETQAVWLDEKDIGDGDVLVMMRMFGVDALIQWGTGSRVGHVAVASRIDGELYILES